MKKLLFCLLACMATTVLGAQTASPEAAAQAAIKATIAKKFPDINIDVVRPSPMKGVYEVVMGADTAYVSADGKFLIAGDLYEIETRTNLTEAGRQKTRVEALAKLDERDMIVFKPTTVKHTITVFTDVDCGYCRKLHSEVKQLTDLGIKVRYLAYPRAGPNTEDWRKMEAVWCAKDRNNAITEAKAGREVKSAQCSAPVAKQFKLGEQMGVRGTPAIFTAAGDYIGGYLTPGQMLKELDKVTAAAKQ
jgi:thiol:disulfide interchange protein DsbC